MAGIILWRASSSFSQETFSHLESMRETKKTYLVDYFEFLQSQLHILRDDPYVGRALSDFNRVADEFKGKLTTPQWEQLAAVHDPHFKDILRNNKWYDLFLINSEGRIVYTVLREPDLGQVISASALKHSSIGYAYNQVQNHEWTLSDFAPYEPSAGAPAGFAMARIKQQDSGQPIGYVAFQIPLDKITRSCKSASAWAKPVKPTWWAATF
jgi:methyl-accepting chemotaxis protein